MARVAPCPTCQALLVVARPPAELSAADVVWGCPSCGAEFPESILADVADSAEAELRVAVPPPLPEPDIGPPPSADASPAEAPRADTASIELAAPSSASAPEYNEGATLEETAAEVDQQPIDSVNEAVEPPPLEVPAADESPAGEPPQALGDDLAPADESSPSPFAFGGTDTPTRAESAAMRARPRPASIGVVGFLLGWLLSAVVGLSLGYLVLILIRGEEGDIFHLREKLRQVWPGGAVDRLPAPPARAPWRSVP